MIKFNKFNVSKDGIKTRVNYSINNHISGKNCVTIYAKDYSGDLSFLENCENNSDGMTDYFEKDRVRIFENDKYYAEALKAALK